MDAIVHGRSHLQSFLPGLLLLDHGFAPVVPPKCCAYLVYASAQTVHTRVRRMHATAGMLVQRLILPPLSVRQAGHLKTDAATGQANAARDLLPAMPYMCKVTPFHGQLVCRQRLIPRSHAITSVRAMPACLLSHKQSALCAGAAVTSAACRSAPDAGAW